MKLRFLGAEPAYVPALGREVTPDEQVEVSDELVHDPDNPTDEDGNPVGLVWPAELWAEVGSRRRREVPIQDAPPPQPDDVPADADTTPQEG